MLQRRNYVLLCGIALFISVVGNIHQYLLATGTESRLVPSSKTPKHIQSHLVPSSKTPKHIQSRLVPSSKNPKDIQPLTIKDMECSQEERNRKKSFRCPARNETTQMAWLAKSLDSASSKNPSEEFQRTYSQNMLSMYNGTDRDLFLHCISLSFPLDHADAAECWPRPVILPSFPTSGNGLFRRLLRNLTYPMEIDMLMYRAKENPTAFYNLATGNNFLAVHGNLDRPVALPLMNRVVVFKSHLGANAREEQLQKVGGLLHNAKSLNKLFGILRLARNPGDNILRNYFRWTHHQCYVKGDECFFKMAKFICHHVSSDRRVKEYTRFHSFWNEFDPDLPQTIVHYEHITSKKYAGEAVKGAMNFLNSLTPPSVDYSRFVEKEKVGKMIEMIKEPDYVHGTLLARVCGKDAARKVHDRTRGVSEPLGYIFDYETATWSLDPQR
jgi:hypothetical protein